ncbi:MAG TPA: glycosyltransferase, partial [Microbacterium sp.]|nr:glycosyltransferase [Microbacterium sp.]
MGRATSTVLISAVVPLYDVERYLPELLQSLSAQEPGDYEIEYIFVDDGSPDGSAALARQWLEDTGASGRVIRQTNAGVSAARNRGLAAATGDWVTFPDSDDVLHASYFRNAARFIQRDGDRVSLVAARLLRLYDADGTVHDVHALQFRFAVGNRLVSMRTHPDFFQMNAASSFFRRRQLVELGVQFPLGLHASEDAVFVADFLLRAGGEPVLGIAADATYLYRRRATADSAVDRSRQDPVGAIGRFHDGYLPILARAEADGGVPEWLQSMFLYECQWQLPAHVAADAAAPPLSEADGALILQALADCAKHVREDVLFGYDATALSLEARLLLQLLAGRPLPAWLGAYRDGDGGVDVPIAAGSEVVVVGADGVPLGITGEVTLADHFGQKVLQRWHATIPRDARVLVDGVPRPDVPQRWEDRRAQQWDRHRRVAVGGTRGAIPARAEEVRVWKPVPGPLGSPWLRARWRVRL